MPSPDVLTVVLTGITLVFLILVLLTVIIFFYGKIMASLHKNDAPAPKKTPEVIAPVAVAAPVASVVEETVDDTEIIAVIAAAVAAMGGGTVVSVKKSGGAVRGGTSFNGWKQSAISSYVAQV